MKQPKRRRRIPSLIFQQYDCNSPDTSLVFPIYWYLKIIWKIATTIQANHRVVTTRIHRVDLIRREELQN